VAFTAGASAELVNATIRAEDAPPAGWVAFLDNTGNRQTGHLRYGLAWRHANLFDADHQINAQIISAPHDADHPQRLSLMPSHKVKIFGLGYRVPFYALGATASLTAGYSDVNSGQVDQLFTIRGKGSSLGLNWTQLFDRPQKGIWRGWGLRWFAGADWRDYKSQLLFGAVDLGVPITLRPLSFGFSGSRAATPQAPVGWQFYAGLWHNLPGGANGGNAAFSASRAGATPHYTLLRYGGGSNVPLGDWRLDVRVDGQWSDDLLVPAEQFSAGGVGSVRGFKERGISGDSGLRSQIEALSPPLWADGESASQLRAVFFFDAAHARRNDPTALERSTETIASLGVGLRANWGPTVLRVDVGKPVHQRTNTPHESGTLHFSLATSF
jgi:hemolysin activation/secretion protein